MSDPIKKPDKKNPESYSPKIPKLINMMEAQSRQQKNLTENVLPGIPYLGYDAGPPVCYAGAVMRLLDFLNDPIKANELYVLSGISLCFPWKINWTCDEVSILTEIPQRTFAALGYESEYIYEPDISKTPRQYTKEFYIKKIKESIDNGHPVIGFGITWLHFSCLITGYYNNGEGLYVRAYWTPGDKSMPEGYDREMYYTTEDWYERCHGIMLAGDKTGERLSGEKAYQYLKESAKIFKDKKSGFAMQGDISDKPQIFYNNAAAFDDMINWLLNDDCWHENFNTSYNDLLLKPCGLFLLGHYRYCLGEYLENISKQCPGVINPEIITAIKDLITYKTGTNEDIGNLTTIDPSITDFSKMSERSARENVAKYVKKVKDIDVKIFDLLLK
jgi:hypothetical protein